ncbi:DUF192 domain-containing protein [Candidatus Pacearchaeota archaeon]|nr:DUF192 domain-containing protein [Candidatus Pacearchaeota archaeon]
MKNKNLYILILCFIILLLLIILYLNFSDNKNKVCFSEKCFDVEIASTQEELSKGLMFRESLDENSGMLFIFQEERAYNFWMKNTLISLDIIWINSNKEVIFIEHNAQPCLRVRFFINIFFLPLLA